MSCPASSHVFNNYNYRDAGKLMMKHMNEFAKSMYLELGVWMVVFGAWVDMDRKKKWELVCCRQDMFTRF